MNTILFATMILGFPLAPTDSTMPPQTASWRSGCGLELVDGELWGVGPGFKARFTESGVEFTPVLGKRATRNRRFSFALEAIHRGEASLFEATSDGGAPPSREGLFVEYRRSSTVVESYEVRTDGVEQRFVFASLPPGSGDLVVRGRVSSDLPSPPAGEVEGEFRFELEGLGGVRVGAVTGIDARGRTRAGRLRFDGANLELVLPGDFVDEAAFPLVLDPLIGPSLVVSGNPGDDWTPDVAYDATSDLYLVVWRRDASASDSDILGQRVSSSGALVGPAIPIHVTSVLTTAHPSVANVNQTDSFLVAWSAATSSSGPWDIQGRAVQASTGAPSAVLWISATAANELTPDVGGDPRIPFPPFVLFPPHALVAWNAEGIGIRGQIVQCPAGGAPTLVGGVLGLSSPGAATDSVPAVSKSCGGGARWLVAWQRFSTSPILDHSDILARIVDTDGVVCGTSTTNLHFTSGPTETNPDCAGDGTNFLVVYQYRPLNDPAYDDSIHVKPVTWTGDCSMGGTPLTVGLGQFVAADPVVDEVTPAIDFAGPKSIVAWSQEVTATNFDLHASALDPMTGAVAEPPTAIDTSGTLEGAPAIGAQRSGSPVLVADQAMIAWHSLTLAIPSPVGDVKVQRVEAIGAGGPVANLGGGCPGGGIAGVNGPPAICNASFSFTLSGAAPSASSGLFVLSPTLGPVSCGPCTLMPTVFIALSIPIAGGSAAVPLPIPCNLALLGATVHFQWLVVPVGGGCPSIPSLALSDALSVTVGL